MQTFLPYSDFYKSLSCLDYKRLGKQRVEAKQIIDTVIDIKKGNIYKVKNGKKVKRGWINHPAVKMWLPYENALKEYTNICIQLWIKKGYNNTIEVPKINDKIIYPHWLGNKQFHASHRSNLLRKNFNFYSKYNWKESTDLEYIWP